MWIFDRVNSRKRDAERLQKAKELKKKERRRMSYHLRRIKAQLRSAELGLGKKAEPIEGRILSIDLNETHLRVFSSEPLRRKSKFAITVGDEQHPIYIRGVVTWCYEVPSETKVRTTKRYRYRSEIALDFSSEQERHLVRQHIRKLYHQHSSPVQLREFSV